VASALEQSAAVLIASLSAAADAKRPFTIIRSYLHVHLRSDQLSADEFQQVAVGMCVVTDQASAIGVTAVPTPSTDADSDMWYLHRWMTSDFAFITGAGFDAASGISADIDSKAARKVNDDQDVLLVAETSALSEGIQLVTAGRFLIKEH